MVLGSRRSEYVNYLCWAFKIFIDGGRKTCSSGWTEADLEARRVSESESGTNQTSVPCWPYSIQAVAYWPCRTPWRVRCRAQGLPALVRPCKNSFGFIIIHFSCVSDGCRFSGPFVRSRAPESCSDALQSCGSGKFWKMDQRHIQSFFLNLQADSFITCCRASFYFILPLKGKMRIRNPLSPYSPIIQNSIIE